GEGTRREGRLRRPRTGGSRGGYCWACWCGEAAARRLRPTGGKSEHGRARWWLTATRRNTPDPAGETRRLRAVAGEGKCHRKQTADGPAPPGSGKGERVR